MVAIWMYLKKPNFIYLCTYLLLVTQAVGELKFKTLRTVRIGSSTVTEGIRSLSASTPQDKKTQEIEVKALGRPLFLGTLYDCREDSFIPGVTLWDMKSLSENVESHPQPYTDSTFHSSDSLSSKFEHLDVSASLKASFLAGLVTVDGSAKYLHDTKSSKHQSRVTLHYSTTTRYEHLTMSQLGQFTYPQVFDQKTATHVVVAVLYGAQAFMVFDRKFSEEEKSQDIEGHLEVMVSNLEYSIKGEGSVNLTDAEKKFAEKITFTFHGDINLKQNPTTYVEAIHIYKNLPNLMEEKKAVPIKVWLYPLHLLNNKAAQLEREISISLVSDTADIIEKLEEAEIACNDLIKRTVVNTFSDFKERLQLFQELLSTYKTKLLQELRSVLPAIRGGNTEEKTLEEILNKHRSSQFNDAKISQWLDDAKSEFKLLSSRVAGPVIVGGTGGDEFTFKSALYSNFKKMIITYNSEGWFGYGEKKSLNTIQVIFQDGQMIQVGSVAGRNKAEFLFEDTDKIVAAKLWPNKNHDRFGGLEFVVKKSNNEKETMSIKSKDLGEPVIVNVGSGRCYGIKGRSGDEIDALGFYFI